MAEKLRGWLWPVLLTALIFGASSRGQVSAPAVVGFDKVAHFAVYGLLATLIARNWRDRHRIWWAVALTSLYGATDEWHQAYTPGRSAEVADWVADTSGALLAVVVYASWPAYRRLLEHSLGLSSKRQVEKCAGTAPESHR